MENRTAYAMFDELRNMFQRQAHQELADTLKMFHACTMAAGKFVHPMLVIAENMKDVPTKPKEVLYVREGGVRKKINRKSKGKGKDKGVAWKKNPQPPKKKKKENPTKDANCFHCGNKGTGRETVIPTLLK
nr:hypothetical protein [Tanacetum cinerariifolium]